MPDPYEEDANRPFDPDTDDPFYDDDDGYVGPF